MDAREPEFISIGTREGPVSDELIALLRQRVATRYYDRPAVIDWIARRMASLGCVHVPH